MFIRVRGILGTIFGKKNVPRSSRRVLGYTEPRPDWVQNGVSLDTPSRLKGIETPCPSRSCAQTDMEPLDTPSRLKGIET